MIQDPRKNPNPFQNVDLSYIVQRHSSLKISSKSVHSFLKYFAHGHTDMYENITSSAAVVNSDVASMEEMEQLLLSGLLTVSFQNRANTCISYRENKKAQLSLTNPRDACEKFARFT